MAWIDSQQGQYSFILQFLQFTCRWIQLFPFISHRHWQDVQNYLKIIDHLGFFQIGNLDGKSFSLIPFLMHKLLPWKLESHHTLCLPNQAQLIHSDNLQDSRWRKDCFIWSLLYRLIQPILFDTPDRKHHLSTTPLNWDWRRLSLNSLNFLL